MPDSLNGLYYNLWDMPVCAQFGAFHLERIDVSVTAHATGEYEVRETDGAEAEIYAVHRCRKTEIEDYRSGLASR